MVDGAVVGVVVVSVRADVDDPSTRCEVSTEPTRVITLFCVVGESMVDGDLVSDESPAPSHDTTMTNRNASGPPTNPR